MGSAALLPGVLLILCVGPVLHVAAKSAADDEPTLPGVYECQGTGADGRPYRGAVVIEPDGNRFLVHWYISAQLAAVGLGIRDGDTLAVSFFSPDAGGVVLYRINGARLVGHWSGPLTAGQVFEETLTRVGDAPVRAPQPPAELQPTQPRPPRPRPFGATRPV